MLRATFLMLALVLTPVAGQAEDAPTDAPKRVGGMSVVGNDDAPKSLAIVPWKASQLGESLDFSSTLEDTRAPLDKAVFMKQLDFYHIRVGAN